MKKIFAFLIAAVLCAGLLSGCGEPEPEASGSSKASGASGASDASGAKTGDPAGEEAFIKSEEDFARRIPNYSCEIHVKNADSETNIIKYKVHPDGIVFQTDMSSDVLMIHDFKNEKTYVLNESDKTGLSMDAPDMSSSFAHPASYFMAWGETEHSTLQKGGSETVDGRRATVYSYKLGASEIKYLIDREMGFCLAYEVSYDGKMATRWEMRNFKAGGVTAADIAVPADYTITAMPSGG